MKRTQFLALAAVLALGVLSPAASAAHFPTAEEWVGLELLRRQEETTNVFLAGEHLVQGEYAIQPAMLDHAARLFQTLYDQHLAPAGCTGYFALVPGKHAFLQHHRPGLDHADMAAYLEAKTPFLTHLDLTPYLSLEDYYHTDSHWRQERLVDVAGYLAQAMGTTVTGPFAPQLYTEDFQGTYAAAVPLALPVGEDRLTFLTSPTLAGFRVTAMDLMGRPQPGTLYDREKAGEGNPYDLYLSGAQGLLTIENPAGDPARELILFRDSFGSSLAPLLAAGYGKTTLVDLRYMASFLLGDYIDFHGQDVLFLYSSLLMNNSMALK